MHYQSIKKLQEVNGFTETQTQINDGSAWTLEGAIGRYAMACLESGSCMLPKKVYYDTYGTKVPSRDELQEGSTGTFKNSTNFWNKVESGEIDLYEY